MQPPGIEPGPSAWKAPILTIRPWLLRWLEAFHLVTQPAAIHLFIVLNGMIGIYYVKLFPSITSPGWRNW
jgi:hypothetical protein